MAVVEEVEAGARAEVAMVAEQVVRVVEREEVAVAVGLEAVVAVAVKVVEVQVAD